MTIAQLRTKDTSWLIAFVRANKQISRMWCCPDLPPLIKFANSEIKRRNRAMYAVSLYKK